MDFDAKFVQLMWAPESPTTHPCLLALDSEGNIWRRDTDDNYALVWTLWNARRRLPGEK